MENNMKIGEIWGAADTDFNTPLFNTVDSFAVTVNVLDGDWIIYYELLSRSKWAIDKWAIGESPEAVDIQTVDGRWRME